MPRIIMRCAVTGAIYTLSMSDYLSSIPAKMGRSSIEAAEASAAIIPLHAATRPTARQPPTPPSS